METIKKSVVFLSIISMGSIILNVYLIFEVTYWKKETFKAIADHNQTLDKLLEPKRVKHE